MIPHDWHTGLPWERLRHLYRLKRTNFFDLPRQETTYLRVQTDGDPVEAVNRMFGEFSYAPRWELSYCRGEDVNLARVVYDERDDFEEVWWQYHLRGYVVGENLIDLNAHYETETTEHPEAHLNSVGYDIGRGLDEVRHILGVHDLDWEEVQYTNDG